MRNAIPYALPRVHADFRGLERIGELELPQENFYLAFAHGFKLRGVGGRAEVVEPYLADGNRRKVGGEKRPEGIEGYFAVFGNFARVDSNLPEYGTGELARRRFVKQPLVGLGGARDDLLHAGVPRAPYDFREPAPTAEAVQMRMGIYKFHTSRNNLPLRSVIAQGGKS